MKYDIVCDECGSRNTINNDAAAYWNEVSQEWEISNVYDKDQYCWECECEPSTSWAVRLEKDKANAA